MEDLRAVLDAAGASKAVVLGAHEGCGMAALYAATYPERTTGAGTVPPLPTWPWDRRSRDAGSAERGPCGVGDAGIRDKLLEHGSPTLYASEEDRRWLANWMRVGASPAVAYALNRALLETDMRDVLPAVRVPTLVLYRSSWEDVALDVAARIPSSRVMRVCPATTISRSASRPRSATSWSGLLRERKRPSFPRVS